jgi:hypothetical protein
MSRLNFKNTALSLLVLSIVAGCTSSPPVNNAPVNKVKLEPIKIRNDQAVDLGDKDGKSIRLNVSLGDKQKFKIKNQFPTTTSVLPLNGSFLELHLYRTPVNAGPNINLPPRDRYDAPAPTSLSDLSQSGTVSKVIIENPGSTNSLVFKGLQAGFNYYISARIYSPALDISTKDWYADTNGDSTHPATQFFNIRTPITDTNDPLYPGDKPVNLQNIGGNPSSSLGLNPTDIISIEHVGVNTTFDENVQVFSPTANITDNFDIYTAGSSPKLGNLIPSYGLTRVKLKKLYRNLVGTDVGGAFANYLGSVYTPGSGMAYYASAPGGGTAAGYATWYGYYHFQYVAGYYDRFHQWEEFITVDGSSQLVINNDDTIGNLYPASGSYIPNNQWDMEVYLMASLTGDNILGDVTIGTGAYDAGGPESLSPTP